MMPKKFCDGLGKPRTGPRPPKPAPPPPCPKLSWSERDLGYEAESAAVPREFYRLIPTNTGGWMIEQNEQLGVTDEQMECGHIRLHHETAKQAAAECWRRELELWELMLAAREIARLRSRR